MDDAADKAERAIRSLIDVDPIVSGDAHLHFDAVTRAIDGSGLPFSTRLALRERLAQRKAEIARRKTH